MSYLIEANKEVDFLSFDKTQEKSHLAKKLNDEAQRSKAFLAQEFLTWLWYRVEFRDGYVAFEKPINHQDHARLWIEHKIVLESFDHAVSKHLLKGGKPTSGIEATTALKSGKYVTELSLGMELNDIEYNFVLSAKDLTPKAISFSLKQEDGIDVIDFASKRINALNHLQDCLDDIFLQFIDTRIMERWDEHDAENMRQWILKRNESLH